MKFIIHYFDHKVTKIFIEKTDEKGDKYVALSSPYNFVSKDEILARVVNAETPEDVPQHVDKDYGYYNVEKYTTIKHGDGVYFDQFSNCYRATEPGFVIFDPAKSSIRIIHPLQISRDKVTAYYVVFPTKFLKLPDYGDIEKVLQKREVITILDKDKIDESLQSIDVNKPKVSRIIVAKGKEAENGWNEYFVPLINLDKKAGKIMHDGRMDFREVGSIIEVVKGQEILRRIPAEKAVDGFDIYGEAIAAVVEKRDGYIKGENIVQSLDDENIFLSGIDGCLSVDNRRVSILPYAIIKGNVDYESGNIDFNGSVQIFGSVMPGFSVKAKGNIVVENIVDDAYLEATGNIVVKTGITGKGSVKIISGGTIKAHYLLNAVVEAVGEIEVEDSIINSRVFSNDKISVTAKHGKIIGGEVTARHEIIVNVVGSAQENATTLTVGKSLFIEREISGIKKEMEVIRETVDETIRKIRTSFGEDLFKNPKEFVSRLPNVKKKNCLLLLKDLSDNNKELKVLTEKYKEVEEKNKLERDPVIVISDVVFPGTIINIQRRRRFIDQKLQNVKFYEDPEEKIIKFISAV
ncbi:MAG TPA: FapA family protein [Spirochaetota bacterium]|nr:FapA family protein [Spirochaetota bacterium]HPQ52337.1 FapA family protein [Spirochaetota bacterium]